MKTARGFAPSNISLLFKVMPDPDPAKMGSLGSGFTVNEGVTVAVSKAAKTTVSYNGQSIDLRTVMDVAKDLTDEPLAIAITSPLPLGSGFGISGASALATAYAINALCDLKKESIALLKIAHRSEVVNKTGLGDVGNQWYGGCCVKFITSSLFQAERLPFTGTTVYVRSWGKIPTPSILSNAELLTSIDTAGDSALAELKKRMHDPSFSFADLLGIANRFTRESGLLSYAPHAQRVMEKIEESGEHAAMIILGDALVSDTQFEGATKLVISEEGVKLL